MQTSCPCCLKDMQSYLDRFGETYSKFRDYVAQLYECVHCNHKKFFPDLSDDILLEAYSSSSFNENDEYHYKKNYDDESMPDITGALKALSKFGLHPPFRLHEYGCGTGLSIHQLRKCGIEATGSDWSSTTINFGQKMGNPHIFLENISTMKEQGNVKIDVFYVNHVVEHIPKIRDFCNNLFKSLSKNTVVYGRCPNSGSLAARRYGIRYDPFFFFPKHYHFFSLRSLLLLFENVGFKVLRVMCTTRADSAINRVATLTVAHLNNPVRYIETMAEEGLTEEIEFLIAHPDSDFKPDETVEVARKSFASSPSTLTYFNNNDNYIRHRSVSLHAYHGKDNGPGKWTYLGSDNLPHIHHEMVFYREGNYHYWSQAAIGQNFLTDGGAGTHPVLCYTASQSGIYKIDIEFAIWYEGIPGFDLLIIYKGQIMDTFDVTDMTPTLVDRLVHLQTGGRIMFAMRSRENSRAQRCKFAASAALCFTENGQYFIGPAFKEPGN